MRLMGFECFGVNLVQVNIQEAIRLHENGGRLWNHYARMQDRG